jgi:hypothetical protein
VNSESFLSQPGKDDELVLYELPNRLERGVLIKNGRGAILTERREIEER